MTSVLQLLLIIVLYRDGDCPCFLLRTLSWCTYQDFQRRCLSKNWQEASIVALSYYCVFRVCSASADYLTVHWKDSSLMLIQSYSEQSLVRVPLLQFLSLSECRSQTWQIYSSSGWLSVWYSCRSRYFHIDTLSILSILNCREYENTLWNAGFSQVYHHFPLQCWPCDINISLFVSFNFVIFRRAIVRK